MAAQITANAIIISKLKQDEELHFLLSTKLCSQGDENVHARVLVCSPSQALEHSPQGPQLPRDCPIASWKGNIAWKTAIRYSLVETNAILL